MIGEIVSISKRRILFVSGSEKTYMAISPIYFFHISIIGELLHMAIYVA